MKIRPDRSKINMQHRAELKHWTRELGVSQAQLQSVIDKVGNSAAAVRKELHQPTADAALPL